MKPNQEERRNSMNKNSSVLMFSMALIVAIGLSGSQNVFAHCDGLDGPVVTAARNALETGEVNLVLLWVNKKDEPEIKQAFQKALAVRKLNPEAKELADFYFFETLVRIHRAGEGEPYSGLKPAGRDLGPAIPAADKAILDGKLEPLYQLLTGKTHEGLHEYFKKVMARKNFDKNNVEAGREYIEAYVFFVHYVEQLYEAAGKAGHGHRIEGKEGEAHKH
jgi:hypothetical protein